MQRLPLILAGLIAVVVIYGLADTWYEDVIVSPWTPHATDGRLYAHTKNTTLLGGSAADVGRAVARAVYLDSSASARASLVGSEICSTTRRTSHSPTARSCVARSAWAIMPLQHPR